MLREYKYILKKGSNGVNTSDSKIRKCPITRRLLDIFRF